MYSLPQSGTNWIIQSSAEVGNSFGFPGHIRDKLGIHGLVPVHDFKVFCNKTGTFLIYNVFS